MGIVLVAEGMRLQSGERPLPIYWSARLLVLMSIVLLRFLYVAALGLMAAVVWLGLGYGKRPLSFRILAAVGAASFVFSDSLIGHMVFVNPDTPLQMLISPTYVLAIILLSHALLAWSEVMKD